MLVGFTHTYPQERLANGQSMFHTFSILEVITSLLEEHGQGGACAENDPRLGWWIGVFGCCFFDW